MNNIAHDLADIVNQSFNFSRSNERNRWLSTSRVSVYVRRSIRAHPDTNDSISCFDIANINVHESGNGFWTKYIEEIKIIAMKAGFEAIFVESVLSDRFAAHLSNTGFIKSSRLNGFNHSNFYFMIKDL